MEIPGQDLQRFVMNRMKEIVTRVPGVGFVDRKYVGLTPKSRTTKDIFTGIYMRNAWGGKHSVSGPGSDTDQTRVIINELSALFGELNIRTVLDCPCGDFHRMKHVKMKGKDYTGAGIVTDLIQKNRQEYETDGVHFCELNLIKDELPKVDLILCRDCLRHFSFRDVFLALHNICDSESTYLLPTTYTGRQRNRDISTGQGHTLNLEAAPFMLPAPLRTINEECTQGHGAYKDKSLGLWRVADIRESLQHHFTPR